MTPTIFWEGDRHPLEPNEAELAFVMVLNSRVPDLEYVLYHDERRAEDLRGDWLFTSEGFRIDGILHILRLDFDRSGIEGGWSDSGLNADRGLRARDIGLAETSKNDYIKVSSSDAGPAQLAVAAADWIDGVRAKYPWTS
jgi:hypothetical protein